MINVTLIDPNSAEAQGMTEDGYNFTVTAKDATHFDIHLIAKHMKGVHSIYSLKRVKSTACIWLLLHRCIHVRFRITAKLRTAVFPFCLLSLHATMHCPIIHVPVRINISCIPDRNFRATDRCMEISSYMGARRLSCMTLGCVFDVWASCLRHFRPNVSTSML